jgi:hypothetical protein
MKSLPSTGGTVLSLRLSEVHRAPCTLRAFPSVLHSLRQLPRVPQYDSQALRYFVAAPQFLLPPNLRVLLAFAPGIHSAP